MTCPTCKREDVGDECGCEGDKECPCCGMQIIARAEEETVPDNKE